MKSYRKAVGCLVIISVFLTMILLTGCASKEPEARKALADFLSYIQAGNTGEAFKLVSDFDKKSISEELFTEWRTSAARIVQKQSFSIGKEYDRFKNYEYMGIRFQEAYGFDAAWKQQYLVDGAQTTDYDQDSFKIMVVQENGSFKMALLLTNLQERTDYYKNQK
jgi:hypothetical protein